MISWTRHTLVLAYGARGAHRDFEFFSMNSVISHSTCTRGTPVLVYGARECVAKIKQAHLPSHPLKTTSLIGRWYHKNMDLLDYLHLQMRLEGKALVDQHFLRQVEVVPEEEMPLMLIAQLVDKKLVAYYDEGIAPELQKGLAANFLEGEFPNFDSLQNVLRSQRVSFEVGHYRTYVFPSRPAREAEVSCFSRHDPNVKAFGFDGFAEKVYAIEQDGRIVSACVSARENERCGEAWVYTEAAYRHQGFAHRVVNAWARSLMEQGKVPFYSHKIENVASANLAKKLGLQSIFEEIAIAQI